jgi:hypothetical protein
MTDSLNLSGINVSSETNFKTLLRNEFLGSALFAGRYDEDPAPGVRAFVNAAINTQFGNRALQALLSLLVDSDQTVRAGAAGTVLHFAERFDPATLLGILRDNPTLFNGVPLLGEKGPAELDLAWTLLRAVAARPTNDVQVIAALREAVRHKNGSWILAGLVTSDPIWVAEHPLEVLDEDPVRANIVLYRLGDPNLREKFVRSIPEESPLLRKALTKAVSEEVHDPTERRHLLSLLEAR